MTGNYDGPDSVNVTAKQVRAAAEYIDAGALVFEQTHGHPAESAGEVIRFLAHDDPEFHWHSDAITVLMELVTVQIGRDMVSDIADYLDEETP